MENERKKVVYTTEPHYDAGLFDNTAEEWEKQKAKHEGLFLSWSEEVRIGACGQNETITVGVIEDAETHKIVRIPQNRFEFV